MTHFSSHARSKYFISHWLRMVCVEKCKVFFSYILHVFHSFWLSFYYVGRGFSDIGKVNKHDKSVQQVRIFNIFFPWYWRWKNEKKLKLILKSSQGKVYEIAPLQLSIPQLQCNSLIENYIIAMMDIESLQL